MKSNPISCKPGLKSRTRKNWSNRPEYYTNDIKVNPKQKDIEMFIMPIRKTCPGLNENTLNSFKALRSENEVVVIFL